MNDHLNIFNTYRQLLFSIAYRMTGSVMDSEDLVQEAFLRWQNVDVHTVTSTKAFLTTIITRLCLDYMQSARVKREVYVGEWLPEPFLGTQILGASEQVILHESLAFAFLVMLESLSPLERAVYLLHDVFAYDYHEIALMVDKTDTNCRQIFKRAKEHLAKRPHRFEVSANQHDAILTQFVQACSTGDVNALLAVLAPDAVHISDGGGMVRSALRPIFGADKVTRFFLGLLKQTDTNRHFEFHTMNGQTAIVGFQGSQVANVTLLDVADGRIRGTYMLTNPHKLRVIANQLKPSTADDGSRE